MVPKILLDMDGVIVDFKRGGLGHPNAVNKVEYKDLTYQFDRQVFTDSDKDFWPLLQRDFWANLEWTTEGKSILNLCIEAVGIRNICICTKPTHQKTVECVAGKLEWIKREIPALVSSFMITNVKYMAASRYSILLDDLDDNCQKFEQHGGNSIIVPQPWNSKRNVWMEDEKIPSEYIEKELYKLISAM